MIKKIKTISKISFLSANITNNFGMEEKYYNNPGNNVNNPCSINNNLGNNVNNPYFINNNIRNNFNNPCFINYNIGNNVNNPYFINYNLRNNVNNPYFINYNLRNNVNNPYFINYNLRNNVNNPYFINNNLGIANNFNNSCFINNNLGIANNFNNSCFINNNLNIYYKINNVNNMNNINYNELNNINFTNPSYMCHNSSCSENKLNYIKNDFSITTVNEDENDIEELEFTKENIDEKIFDDFIDFVIINYRNLKVLKFGKLDISKNIPIIRKLFYVKEPETVVFNRKNIVPFEDNILADYNTFSLKKVIFEDILPDNEDLAINIEGDVYNMLMLFSYDLKNIYKNRTRKKFKEYIGLIYKSYNRINKVILSKIEENKLNNHIVIEKNNDTFEYYYKSFINLSKIGKIDVKLSYIKFKSIGEKIFEIIDVNTERKFRRLHLATKLFKKIKKYHNNFSFITVSTSEESNLFFKNLGFLDINDIENNDKEIYNKYCEKFELNKNKKFLNLQGVFVFDKVLNNSFKNKNK